jgi:aspartyl-tRNA synthetase
MFRTYHCGELRKENIGEIITLSGWIHSIRNFGSVSFINLRDHYGITQLSFYNKKRLLNREFIICIYGEVIERLSKNFHNATGDIEVIVIDIKLLNYSCTPPFTIEDRSDSNEELRMKYRYLDIRRNLVKNKIIFRHKVIQAIRKYLSKADFIEVETPILVKSSPEGARDFIVPSRINPGFFYALPQSPQSFKQLLMIGGFDKYFQIVKCFRDEDFRVDRQPEFTQIDCEMSFINKEDLIKFFDDFIIYIFKYIRGIQLKIFNISYKESMHFYGSDKPDLRFEFKFVNLNSQKNILLWDKELVMGINAKGCAQFTMKKLNEVISYIPQISPYEQGLIWVKCLKHGKFKSSIDCDNNDLKNLAFNFEAKEGDFLIIIYGETEKTQRQLGELRLEIGRKLGFCSTNNFAAVWIIDFPLFKNENKERYYTLHHPFTNPQQFLLKKPERMMGQAYDLVINGIEIGGGSIRIHKSKLQEQVLKMLGFSKEKTYKEFGFLINSFKYGAPPHGGVAFGLDRLVAILFGEENIRDFIAFPKNNAGKDLMIESPSIL